MSLASEIGDTFIDWREIPPSHQWQIIINKLWDHGYEIVDSSDRSTGKPPGQGPRNPGGRPDGPDVPLTVGNGPSPRCWERELNLLARGPDLPHSTRYRSELDYFQAVDAKREEWVIRMHALLVWMDHKLVRPKGRHERPPSLGERVRRARQARKGRSQ